MLFQSMDAALSEAPPPKRPIVIQVRDGGGGACVVRGSLGRVWDGLVTVHDSDGWAWDGRSLCGPPGYWGLPCGTVLLWSVDWDVQGSLSRCNSVGGVWTMDISDAEVTMGRKVLKMAPGKALRIVGLEPP